MRKKFQDTMSLSLCIREMLEEKSSRLYQAYNMYTYMCDLNLENGSVKLNA